MKKAFYYGLVASVAGGLILFAFRLGLGIVTPFEVLSDIIVRFLPFNFFLAGVNTFGTAAKGLSLILLVVLSVFAGGLFGMGWHAFKMHFVGPRGRWKWWPAAVVGLTLWVVENVSLFPASGRGVFGVSAWPWPAAMEMVWLLTSIIYSFLFTGLTMKRESARKPEEAPDLSRRLFLKRLAYAGAGLVLAGAFGSYLWRLIESGRRSLTGTGRISSEITPNEDFYAVSKNFIPPVVDARSWNLEIKGLVDHDLTISYKRLKEFPSSTYYLTLECIGNEIGGQQVGNAKWKGTLLRDVLSLVSIDSSAKKVVLYGTDDYTDSITPDQALAADVLLAYEMNDEPLPSEHGFPVRLLIPGIYGMKNVKWVTKLEFVDYDYQGFWEEAGWSDKAVIQTMSRIDAPLSGARVGTAESVTIGGIAFAGDRGISEVQVSTDGGKMWNKVRVKEALSPYSWSLWAYDWAPPGSGTYTTLVRAIDGHGTLQTQTVRQPLPDGATGYDSTIIVAATKP